MGYTIPMNKVSLIITTLNEEKTIVSLLKSIRDQTLLPDEVIIVDGGSVDITVSLVDDYIKKSFIKKGNRSVGRNFAISKARNNWIAITDAGCILDKNWLKELVDKQKNSNAEVVAGYYKAAAESVNKKPLTSFEKAVVPYVLVMPNKVDKDNFLPATRSVLISKKAWEKVGRFDESLSDNEDYAFAKKLESERVKIAFAQKAVVGWMPPSTLKYFTKMIFRFARGDVYAGILRPKVLLIFVRYLFGFLLFSWGLIQLLTEGNLWILFGLVPGFLLIYALWSIVKNYRYIKGNSHWLPVLQVASDLAVMWGSMCGLVKRRYEEKK
jgi:glycosyltransferase involved in cell wall biosynthesis